MVRNCVVHEGKLCGVQELASRVGKFNCDYWHAWQQKNSLLQGKYVWKAPPNGKVKVNVDVAIRDQFAVIAALIRDSNGVVKGSKFEKIEAVQPLEGEVAAAKLGIDFAMQMRFWDIILEGDSAIVIKAI
ncbi:hypothetical protein CJ030_MR2G005731 [Morella rubra]|uniref:RNase H type-1 domain-containing protein n=1 Tax=Morella rubra TaxID=262757 RepID=A0A6A1WIG9_9ROSI|nr:hypothetical protein CJ030_MR2G005731 [Morella rubra]